MHCRALISVLFVVQVSKGRVHGLLPPRTGPPNRGPDKGEGTSGRADCAGSLLWNSDNAICDLLLIGCELGQVRAEFNEYKKSGEHRQVAQRRRIATMIKAVQDAGGIKALESRWPQGKVHQLSLCCRRPSTWRMRVSTADRSVHAIYSVLFSFSTLLLSQRGGRLVKPETQRKSRLSSNCPQTAQRHLKL